MLIVDQIREIKKELFLTKLSSKSIGFVPTMGALHEGHLQLVRESKAENDITVCSIFVNPIQFNNPEDLLKYPRPLEEDIKLLEKEGCDYLFVPSVSEMYPTPPSLHIDFGIHNTIMEGAFRAGHFSGVGIVVAKLFNIIQPERSYFGQKDFQQCIIIRQLVENLSMPLEIKIIPTKREKDGLAMSSRNRRLGEYERKMAPKIYQALKFAELQILHSPIAEVKEKVMEILSAIDRIYPEYVEVVDYESGLPTSEFLKAKRYAICIAARVGDIRLIDNIIINP